MEKEPMDLYDAAEEEVSKKKKNTKGFYVAFGLCLCAIGAAAWYTYSDVSEYMEPQQEITTVEKQEQQAEAKLEGVTQPNTNEYVEFATVATESPTEPVTEAEEVAAQEEEQPASLFYPVNKEITKVWSGETPVYFETLKDWRLHKAVDFKAKQGETVKSIDSGMVTNIYTDDLYGATITIEHKSGFVASYSGVQSSENLNTGDHVSGGDVIGKVTKIPCESKETSHIHLEVKKDGEAIDPAQLFA